MDLLPILGYGITDRVLEFECSLFWVAKFLYPLAWLICEGYIIKNHLKTEVKVLHLISKFTYQESPYVRSVQFWVTMVKWGHSHCQNKDWEKDTYTIIIRTRHFTNFTYLEEKHFPASSSCWHWIWITVAVIYLYRLRYYFDLFGGGTDSEIMGLRSPHIAMNEEMYLSCSLSALFIEKRSERDIFL